MKRRIVPILIALFLLFFCIGQALSGDLDKGLVSITFDDGDVSLDLYAKPILTGLGIPATAYIVTGSIPEAYTVTWKNLWEMQQNHGWEIANHTKWHLSLTSLKNWQIRDEVLAAQKELVKFGFVSSGSFAPPFGAYDERVLDVLRCLNVVTSSRQAWTVNGDFLNKPQDFNRWELKVVGLTNAPTFNDMAYVMDRAVEEKGWVIFLFHGVWPEPEVEYEMTPQLLEQMATYADTLRSQGLIDIVTVSQGVSKMLHQKSLPWNIWTNKEPSATPMAPE